MASQDDEKEKLDSINNDQEYYNLNVYKKYDSILNDKLSPFESKVTSLIEVWKSISELKHAHFDIKYLIQIIDWAKLHALNIVLTGEWNKIKDPTRNEFITLLESAKKSLSSVNDAFSARCQKLVDVVKQPWEDPILKTLLQKKNLDIGPTEVEFFCIETAYLVSVRLKKLCENHCEDLALNFVRNFLKYKKIAISQKLNLNATETQLWFIFDIYIALLFKFDEKAKIIDEFDELPLYEGVQLTKRFTKKRVKISKIWRKAIRVAVFGLKFYISKVLMNFGDNTDQTQILLTQLIQTYLNITTDKDMLEEFIENIRECTNKAADAEGLCHLVEIIHREAANRMPNFIIEMYIRALTTDMNHLERYKLQKDEPKVKSTTSRLSGAYDNMAELLSDHIKISRECALTAFSIEPTKDRLEKLEELAQRSGYTVTNSGLEWKCRLHPPVLPTDDVAWICPECGDWMCKPELSTPLQVNTPLQEALQESTLNISEALCDDLVVCLSNPRYQILSWSLSWQDLYRLCILYLNDPERTKNFVTELKFVDLDYSMFDHIKKEPVEEFTGIEKGYEQYLDAEFQSDEEDTSCSAASQSEDSASLPCVGGLGSDGTGESNQTRPQAKSDPKTLKSLRMFRPSQKRKQDDKDDEILFKLTNRQLQQAPHIIPPNSSKPSVLYNDINPPGTSYVPKVQSSISLPETQLSAVTSTRFVSNLIKKSLTFGVPKVLDSNAFQTGTVKSSDFTSGKMTKPCANYSVYNPNNFRSVVQVPSQKPLRTSSELDALLSEVVSDMEEISDTQSREPKNGLAATSLLLGEQVADNLNQVDQVLSNPKQILNNLILTKLRQETSLHNGTTRDCKKKQQPSTHRYQPIRHSGTDPTRQRAVTTGSVGKERFKKQLIVKIPRLDIMKYLSAKKTSEPPNKDQLAPILDQEEKDRIIASLNKRVLSVVLHRYDLPLIMLSRKQSHPRRARELHIALYRDPAISALATMDSFSSSPALAEKDPTPWILVERTERAQVSSQAGISLVFRKAESRLHSRERTQSPNPTSNSLLRTGNSPLPCPLETDSCSLVPETHRLSRVQVLLENCLNLKPAKEFRVVRSPELSIPHPGKSRLPTLCLSPEITYLTRMLVSIDLPPIMYPMKRGVLTQNFQRYFWVSFQKAASLNKQSWLLTQIRGTTDQNFLNEILPLQEQFLELPQPPHSVISQMTRPYVQSPKMATLPYGSRFGEDTTKTEYVRMTERAQPDESGLLTLKGSASSQLCNVDFSDFGSSIMVESDSTNVIVDSNIRDECSTSINKINSVNNISLNCDTLGKNCSLELCNSNSRIPKNHSGFVNIPNTVNSGNLLSGDIFNTESDQRTRETGLGLLWNIEIEHDYSFPPGFSSKPTSEECIDSNNQIFEDIYGLGISNLDDILLKIGPITSSIPPKLDLLFGSDEYGDELIDCLSDELPIDKDPEDLHMEGEFNEKSSVAKGHEDDSSLASSAIQQVQRIDETKLSQEIPESPKISTLPQPVQEPDERFFSFAPLRDENFHKVSKNSCIPDQIQGLDEKMSEVIGRNGALLQEIEKVNDMSSTLTQHIQESDKRSLLLEDLKKIDERNSLITDVQESNESSSSSVEKVKEYDERKYTLSNGIPESDESRSSFSEEVRQDVDRGENERNSSSKDENQEFDKNSSLKDVREHDKRNSPLTIKTPEFHESRSLPVGKHDKQNGPLIIEIQDDDTSSSPSPEEVREYDKRKYPLIIEIEDSDERRTVSREHVEGDSLLQDEIQESDRSRSSSSKEVRKHGAHNSPLRGEVQESDSSRSSSPSRVGGHDDGNSRFSDEIQEFEGSRSSSPSEVGGQDKRNSPFSDEMYESDRSRSSSPLEVAKYDKQNSPLRHEIQGSDKSRSPSPSEDAEHDKRNSPLNDDIQDLDGSRSAFPLEIREHDEQNSLLRNEIQEFDNSRSSTPSEMREPGRNSPVSDRIQDSDRSRSSSPDEVRKYEERSSPLRDDIHESNENGFSLVEAVNEPNGRNVMNQIQELDEPAEEIQEPSKLNSLTKSVPNSVPLYPEEPTEGSSLSSVEIDEFDSLKSSVTQQSQDVIEISSSSPDELQILDEVDFPTSQQVDEFDRFSDKEKDRNSSLIQTVQELDKLGSPLTQKTNSPLMQKFQELDERNSPVSDEIQEIDDRVRQQLASSVSALSVHSDADSENSSKQTNSGETLISDPMADSSFSLFDDLETWWEEAQEEMQSSKARLADEITLQPNNKWDVTLKCVNPNAYEHNSIKVKHTYNNKRRKIGISEHFTVPKTNAPDVADNCDISIECNLPSSHNNKKVILTYSRQRLNKIREQSGPSCRDRCFSNIRNDYEAAKRNIESNNGDVDSLLVSSDTIKSCYCSFCDNVTCKGENKYGDQFDLTDRKTRVNILEASLDRVGPFWILEKDYNKSDKNDISAGPNLNASLVQNKNVDTEQSPVSENTSEHSQVVNSSSNKNSHLPEKPDSLEPIETIELDDSDVEVVPDDDVVVDNDSCNQETSINLNRRMKNDIDLDRRCLEDDSLQNIRQKEKQSRTPIIVIDDEGVIANKEVEHPGNICEPILPSPETTHKSNLPVSETDTESSNQSKMQGIDLEIRDERRPNKRKLAAETEDIIYKKKKANITNEIESAELREINNNPTFNSREPDILDLEIDAECEDEKPDISTIDLDNGWSSGSDYSEGGETTDYWETDSAEEDESSAKKFKLVRKSLSWSFSESHPRPPTPPRPSSRSRKRRLKNADRENPNKKKFLRESVVHYRLEQQFKRRRPSKSRLMLPDLVIMLHRLPEFITRKNVKVVLMNPLHSNIRIFESLNKPKHAPLQYSNRFNVDYSNDYYHNKDKKIGFLRFYEDKYYSMITKVKLRSLCNSNLHQSRIDVPGLYDYSLLLPAKVNHVVNVVQHTIPHSPSIGDQNVQTSTQVSPHIQRIGQPKASKSEESATAESKTSNSLVVSSSGVGQSSTSLNNNLNGPNLLPINTDQVSKPASNVNILSQQVIRPGTSQQQTEKMPSEIGEQKTATLLKNDSEDRPDLQITKTVNTNVRIVTTTTQAGGTSTTPTAAPGSTILQFICKSSTLPQFQQAFGKTVYQVPVTSSSAGLVVSTGENCTQMQTATVETKKVATKTVPVSVQPIAGNVIFRGQVPLGQTVSLIPPGSNTRQLFRITGSTHEQISLVKETVIQNKMSALLAAALQGKPKISEQNGEVVEEYSATRITLCRPGTVSSGSRIVAPVQLQIPANNVRAPQPNVSSTTLEQLREFDMVYNQVKERSNNFVPPDTNSKNPQELTQQQRISFTYVNQVQKYTQLSPVVVVSSYNPLQQSLSSASVTSQAGSCITQVSTVTVPKVAVKSSKGKSIKSSVVKTSPPAVPAISKPQQKPQEDEHTTQRIFDILAEYAEQLRNSPDLNNKPAPRRRSNPPTNPCSNSCTNSPSKKKKKKSSSSSASPNIIETDNEELTMGSEDSSGGNTAPLSTTDEEQSQSAISATPPESNLEPTSVSSPPVSTARPIIVSDSIGQSRNVIITDSNISEALKMPNTALLMPGNYIMPVSVVKGGQHIAVVSGVSGGNKILTTLPTRSGQNMLLFQSFLNQNKKGGISTVKCASLQPLSSQAAVRSQPSVVLPSNSVATVALGQPIAIKKIDNSDSNEVLFTISPSREVVKLEKTTDVPRPDSSSESKVEEDTHSAKAVNTIQKTNSVATSVIASTMRKEEQSSLAVSEAIKANDEPKPSDRNSSVLVNPPTSNGPMLSYTYAKYKKSTEVVESTTPSIKDLSRNTGRKQATKPLKNNAVYYAIKTKKPLSKKDSEVQKQAAIERELRLQKTLSEECEDLGVDEPSTSDLFPEADLLFDTNHSPSYYQASQKLQSTEAKPKTPMQFSDDENSGSLRNDLFEYVEYQHSQINGNNAGTGGYDATLLPSSGTMSEVTLSDPMSSEYSDTTHLLNKYKYKYSNRKKGEKVKVASHSDNSHEVTSSESDVLKIELDEFEKHKLEDKIEVEVALDHEETVVTESIRSPEPELKSKCPVHGGLDRSLRKTAKKACHCFKNGSRSPSRKKSNSPKPCQEQQAVTKKIVSNKKR